MITREQFENDLFEFLARHELEDYTDALLDHLDALDALDGFPDEEEEDDE